MEANHFRPEGLDDRAVCVIEWGPICGSHLDLGIDTELDIVGFELLAPLAIDKRVIFCRGIAEEVHVDGGESSLPVLYHRFRMLSQSYLSGRIESTSTCYSNCDSPSSRTRSG